MIVVGGGAAGLAAALRLRRAGHPVRVLEASDAVGAKLSTAERDGFVIDRGAFFLPTTHRRMLALAAELGLEDRIVPGGFVLAVARGGEIHHVRGERLLRDVATTGLLSPRAKLGLAALLPELARARRATYDRIGETAPDDTETVAQWSERLNPEIAEYITGATMRAVFAIAPESVSKVDFLAVIALFGGAKLVALDRGMAVFAQAAAEQLTIELGARVTAVAQHGDEVQVTWSGPGGERTERAPGCVIATPAGIAADLYQGLDEPRRSYLQRVRDGRLLILNVALARAPAGVDATYVEIPSSVHPFLGGIVFDHLKAPGRVPAGRGLLTLAPLNGWCESHYDDDDETITAELLAALERVLGGVTDQVEFVLVSRWNQQYNPVGHYRGLGEFRRTSAARDRLVQLAGEYHASPNLNVAMASGLDAADRLLAAVGSPGRGEAVGATAR